MTIIKHITQALFTKHAMPYWSILLVDALIVGISALLAVYFAYGGTVVLTNFWALIRGIVLCILVYAAWFRIVRTYHGVVRYSSTVDFFRLAKAMIGGTLCCMVLTWGVELLQVPPTIIRVMGNKAYLLLFVIALMLMWASRIIVKLCYEIYSRDSKARGAFIFGVHQGGVELARIIRNEEHHQLVLKGFVSDENDMIGKELLGQRIYPLDDNLVDLMKKHEVKVLLISSLVVERFREMNDLIDQLIEADIRIMLMPQPKWWEQQSGRGEIREGSEARHELREIEVEDLLPRKKIDIDMQAVSNILVGQSILITGAAGSIGSEIVRQVATFRPRRLVLIDQAETPMHDLRVFLAREFPEVEAHTVVASITSEAHMAHLFETYRPAYVFHAAAYKHVPMMEDNPTQAVQNNIYGTRVIADLAVKYGTRKFVMISTDKAVNPTNVMGCSKRICEIYCQALDRKLREEYEAAGRPEDSVPCQFVTTRFGNVLGSNGSVIPLFKEQIRKGGPITVTHPDIIRFFMLISEACRLVLEAAVMGHGGEIFVFDMGEPVRILDLAKRMIKLSGCKDIEIKFTGLREGEKLYEEVLASTENTKPTVHPMIMVANVREYPYDEIKAHEEQLYAKSATCDEMEIVAYMKQIVPEYKSPSSKYAVLDK